MLCALGAEIDLVSTSGERALTMDALYRDDGIEYTAKRPDEILSRIRVPRSADSDSCRTAFWKLRRRGLDRFRRALGGRGPVVGR